MSSENPFVAESLKSCMANSKESFLSAILESAPVVDYPNELVMLLRRARVRALVDGKVRSIALSLKKQLKVDIDVHSHGIIERVDNCLFSDKFKTQGMLAIHLRICGERCVVILGLDAVHDLPPYIMQHELTPVLCPPTQQDITIINYLVAQTLIDITQNVGQRAYLTGANIYASGVVNELSSEQYMQALDKALASGDAIALPFSLLMNGSAYSALVIFSSDCVCRIASYGRFAAPCENSLSIFRGVSTRWNFRFNFSKYSLSRIASLACGERLQFGSNVSQTFDGELTRINNTKALCEHKAVNYKTKLSSIDKNGTMDISILEQQVNAMANKQIGKTITKGVCMEANAYHELQIAEDGNEKAIHQINDFAIQGSVDSEDLYGAYSKVVHKGECFLSHRQVQLLSDLYVPLDVELANISIAADKLIDLAPGDILRCAFDPNEPVRLCVAGEVIAKAKFVKDGESLALEILHLGEKIENKFATNSNFSPNIYMGEVDCFTHDYVESCRKMSNVEQE